MKHLHILLARIVLSGILSVFISVVFFGGIRYIWIGILSVMLVVLAYLFEYTKKQDKN
jgi:hypothetical protein